MARTDFNKHNKGKASDLDSEIPIGSSGDELIYKCIYCEKVRGKPDTEGKLYFNQNKRVGFCFKCETKVLGDSVISERDVLFHIGKKNNGVHVSDEIFSLDNWTVDVKENQEVYEYCQRRDITDDLIGKFNLRACSSPITGLVIPNKNLDDGLRTDYFQVRNINDGAYLKYNNLKRHKPMFYVDKFMDKKSLLVCEGTLSAVSASTINSDFGVASLLGKSVRDEHLSIIKKMKSLESLYIVLDGGYYTEMIKSAYKLLKTGKSVYITMLDYGQDPNSIKRNSLKEQFEKYSFNFNELTHNLMKTFTRYPNTSNGWNAMRNGLKNV